ncbi:hypothetical protein AOCH_001133 [Aspergillus ochraceoroseus]|uniref:Uncharacterized protein n=1 Tax=Aspergillus ochraceoroseus TaxID=138278 RepID=A0A0F8XGJ7_9EURO|nr:hypothetical protein AOCH_001133 [Aspergillus ochraceoroseus]
MEDGHVPRKDYSVCSLQALPTPGKVTPYESTRPIISRYQIAAKIGGEQVRQWRWLPPRYVAIKVNANNYASQESAEKELRITEHITKANPQHPGRNFVATL